MNPLSTAYSDLKRSWNTPTYNPYAEAIYSTAMSAPPTQNIAGEIFKNILAAMMLKRAGQAKKSYLESERYSELAYRKMEKEQDRQNKLVDEKSMINYRAGIEETDKKRAFKRTVAAGILNSGLITEPGDIKSLYAAASGTGALPEGIFGKLSTARKAEEERKRQTSIADEASKLNQEVRAKGTLTGIEKAYDYLDPAKYTISDMMRQQLTGKLGEINNPDASVDPNLISEQARGIVSGGGIRPYAKPEYKEVTRSVQDEKGNWWEATYVSTDGGLTLSQKPVSVKPLYKPSEQGDGSKAENQEGDDFRSWVTHLDTLYQKKASLESLRGDFGEILTPEDAKVALNTIQAQIDDSERYIRATYPEHWNTKKTTPPAQSSVAVESFPMSAFPRPELLGPTSGPAKSAAPTAAAPKPKYTLEEIDAELRRKEQAAKPDITPKATTPQKEVSELDRLNARKKELIRASKWTYEDPEVKSISKRIKELSAPPAKPPKPAKPKEDQIKEVSERMKHIEKSLSGNTKNNKEYQELKEKLRKLRND